MSRDEAALHLRLAEEKLAAARALLDEGFLRDAASRAYYAMYHAVYALVRSKGLATKTHRGLVHLVGKEFVSPQFLSPELVASLRRGLSVRELSDYEATFSPPKDAVEELVGEAARFVARVGVILG